MIDFGSWLPFGAWKKLIKPLDEADPLLLQLKFIDIFEAAFKQILSQEPGSATGQVFIANPRMHNNAIATKLTRCQNMSFDDISSKLCAVLNSDESIDLEKMDIALVIYNPVTANASY